MAKKGIMEWAKDLKSNPKIAKKFMSVKTVSDILKVAKENGYEFTENELMDPDLNTVAGGVDGPAGPAAVPVGKSSSLGSTIGGLGSGAGAITVTVNPNVVVTTAISTATATAAGATAQSNPVMNISTDLTK